MKPAERRWFSVGLGRFVAYSLLAGLLLYHYPLWSYLLRNLDLGSENGWRTVVSVLAVLLLFNCVVFSGLALVLGRGFRFLVILFFLSNAVAVYFVQTYGVILDKNMIGNVFNTNAGEAFSFFGGKLVAYFLLLGVLPAMFIGRFEIRRPVRRLPLLLFSVAGILLSVLWLSLNAKTWLWLDKHSKFVGGLVMPWSYVVNAIRYQSDRNRLPAEVTLLPDGRFTRDGKVLVVLVIGESARAASFSLYGYERDTNPRLGARADLMVLPNSYSATTYTTASIHSLLAFDGSTRVGHEVLPSYLTRQGAGVLWRSNNEGEPDVVVTDYRKARELRQSCKEGAGCRHDEVLLSRLVEDIESLEQDKILAVLHMAGSHGPSYYRKYPPEFERFRPVCTGVDLDRCGRERLVNAYDNSILYTDFVLARLIEMLEKAFPDREVLMLYVSDHGESLGESGLYLHGTPYAIAPDYQKQIPFILWASPRMRLRLGSVQHRARYGHDNVFHTVLGALGLDSPAYDPGKDVFRPPAAAMRPEQR